MVRLLQGFVADSLREVFGFNPTMVRLLLYDVSNTSVCPNQFQSHNGAIAAHSVNSPVHQLNSVSIPQWCDCCNNTVSVNLCVVAGFNPTMVRLLRLAHYTCPSCNGRFQSHNGAIAAVDEYLSEAAFNFVSIPQWCDCCRR